MAVASLLSKITRRKRTLKDRTREVKGKNKSKKFEEIKKKADEADKKKADKADKKASSPKMAAEKKAARPARGDAKDLKKDDWTASKSKSYYATTYDKKKLYANREDWDFFKGHLEAYDRGKQTCIKIHTGKIDEEFLYDKVLPLESYA